MPDLQTAKMIETIKEAIRQILFVPEWLGIGSGVVTAKEGSLKDRFYRWLYGEEAALPVWDGWTYPEEDGSER